jgi:hypothetical protein
MCDAREGTQDLARARQVLKYSPTQPLGLESMTDCPKSQEASCFSYLVIFIS